MGDVEFLYMVDLYYVVIQKWIALFNFMILPYYLCSFVMILKIYICVVLLYASFLTNKLNKMSKLLSSSLFHLELLIY